ncbi:ComF family protein [Tenuibacillus multivorans]|uniref:Competence protein ComFC n=1 Tax=Tenuibacillus multivorans TaxID=237069 RepID=A0A1H0G706_9BACI|nr:ComF family protein [Tenuibacillus multivorans]GEL78717.1 ComF operon protein 3 [Tenuibacillus multivorans]SDO02652.1 competence protein ComFC [Tenuibacillus multivorans]
MHCLICYESTEPSTTWATMFDAEDRPVCSSCLEKFERIDQVDHHCEKCMKIISQHETLCGDCHAWQGRLEEDPLTRNISAFTYNDYMKDIMAQFKYRGDYELVYVWKEAITETYDKHFGNQKLTVVPIPLSDKRLRERGFNQAEALAQLIGHPIQNLLIRTHSEKQSKKTKLERILSQNPFHTRKNSPHQILLVDDIYTTGTTLRQAAEVLRSAGAQEVFSITLIRS